MTPAHRLSERERAEAIRDCAWLFEVGYSTFERSTFGGLLEALRRADTRYLRRARGPITARPRSLRAAGGEAGYEPDEGALMRFGDASRRLLAVGRADRLAGELLARCYGEPGARAQHTMPGGRLDAALALSAAGAALIERERRASKTALSDGELLSVAIALAEHDEIRAELLKRARAEAAARHEIALQLWVNA